MAFFAWSEHYSVGISSIDEQHKELVKMVNDLYQSIKEDTADEILGELLGRLIDYTRSHFAHEESLMHSSDFPGFEAHREAHIKLTAQVMDFEKQFRLGRATISLDLGTFLRDWLSQHILGTDKKLGQFLLKGRDI